jgi:hypothetical protein
LLLRRLSRSERYLDSLSDFSAAVVYNAVHTVFTQLVIRHKKSQTFNGRTPLLVLPHRHTVSAGPSLLISPHSSPQLMNHVRARPQSVEVVDWSSSRQRAVYDKMYAHAKQKFDYFVARGQSCS